MHVMDMAVGLCLLFFGKFTFFFVVVGKRGQTMSILGKKIRQKSVNEVKELNCSQTVGDLSPWMLGGSRAIVW